MFKKLLLLAPLVAMVIAACNPVSPPDVRQTVAPGVPQAQTQEVVQPQTPDQAVRSETAPPTAPQPQATPTPAWYPPPFQTIPADAEEMRRRAAAVPVFTPQGGGDDTFGLPPGGRRDLSKTTIAPIPPPRPTLSAQDADTALSVFMADPAIGPKLTGKKYRVIQNVPGSQMRFLIARELARLDPTLTQKPQEFDTKIYSHPCASEKACAGLVLFNYTDNYPIEAMVDLGTRKVIISMVPSGNRWPDPTLDEVELAKAIAIKDTEFLQKVAGRPNHYEFFQGFGGPGRGFRSVIVIYSVGNRVNPDERLWVAVNLRDEKVYQVIRR